MDNRISAASNLTIEMQPNRWRLLVNGNTEETVLVEAIPGQPLRYLPRFGDKRRLPDSGALPVAYIQRVVLGWSNEDEAWHLGLVLEPNLAQARGSRWCEIAHWPDPETTVFGEIASRAGQMLAQTITRPFNFIPPGAAPAAPPPLPDLPLKFDLWTLERVDANRLQFTRASSWARGVSVRVVWYSLLLVVYVVLAVTSLLGDIALPSPAFLPYLGLASALILIGMIAITLVQWLTTVSRIVVDSGSGSVLGLRGRRERWRINREHIQAIYVSQIVKKKGSKQAAYHGELNLHLRDGVFRHLLEQAQWVAFSLAGDELAQEQTVGGERVIPLDTNESGGLGNDRVSPLAQADVHTDLQAAGLYLAQTLNVPCLYDQRRR